MRALGALARRPFAMQLDDLLDTDRQAGQRPRDLGPFEVGVGEVDAAQRSVLQVGALEIGAFDVGALHFGVLEVGLNELRPFQVSAHQRGALQVGTGENDAPQVAIVELGAAEFLDARKVQRNRREALARGVVQLARDAAAARRLGAPGALVTAVSDPSA